MTRKIIRYIAVRSILQALSAGACLAATWYVRPAGFNYGSGNGTSLHNAWSGFTHINWASINPGDTLYMAGTFNEMLTVPKSGSSGGLITVRGDLANNPGIIDVSTGDAVNISGQTYVALDGITINRSGTNGVTMQGTSYCQVRNCNIYQVGQSGGTLFGIDGRYAQGIYIYNCRLTNERGEFKATGIVAALGLSGNLATSTVDRCYIFGTDVDGIVAGNDTVVSRCTVSGLINLTNHPDGIVVEGSRVTVRQEHYLFMHSGRIPRLFRLRPWGGEHLRRRHNQRQLDLPDHSDPPYERDQLRCGNAGQRVHAQDENLQ